ncbi:galactose oxidase [Taibaiella lutea]|uniref:Galactose oxidase n=1 Tax=Taibaiella lutea TaxID=2608001 RepID=A0A5M6CAX6_9BACT|nr:kelch repeat-containing protein [Taibaiella lutea]KAA5532326.1 galactose oxidase [Taibaiella lutea]
MIQKKAPAFHLTKNAAIVALGLFTVLSASCKKDDTPTTTTVGDWMRSSDFEGVARTEAVGFVLNGNAYVGTGYKQDDVRLSDFWAYDQASQTWFQKADMPGAPRNSAVAFTVGSKAYVGTGYDGINQLNDFYSYDPATNKWDTIANFGGSGRYGAVAFSSATKGYVGTGFDGNYLKDFYSYNPANDTWTQTASLGGTKRQNAVAFTIGDKSYVVTGINNGSYPDDVWEFNAANETWAQKTRIANINADDTYDDLYGSIPRSNASVFVMDNIAYLAGGNSSGLNGTVFAYDPSTDRWTQKTGFEGTIREGAVGFNLNNRGYIVTGNNSGSRFDDMWEFLPNNDVIAGN